jgi:uncharacterized membrane protein SirB2
VEAVPLKYLHVTCVALSYALFFLRGVWMLRGWPARRGRWAKVVPHLVDSVLLVSAVALAVQLGISPLTAPWLLAKIIALLLYIALGAVALRRGPAQRFRLAAWLAAQAVFFYIVSVAVTHDPAPWRILGA